MPFVPIVVDSYFNGIYAAFHLVTWEEPLHAVLRYFDVFEMPSRLESFVVMFDSARGQFTKIWFTRKRKMVELIPFERIFIRLRFFQPPLTGCA